MLLWSLLLMEAILVSWKESGQGSPLTWIESSSSLCRPWLNMDMNSPACSSLGAFGLNHHIKATQLSAQILTTVYKADKPAGGEEVQNDMQKPLFWENKTTL